MWDIVFDWFLDRGAGHFFISAPGVFKCPYSYALNCLSALLSRYGVIEASERTKDMTFRKVIERGPYSLPNYDLEADADCPIHQLCAELDTLIDLPISSLSVDREAWSSRLESARNIWGTRWALIRLAVLAAEIDEGQLSGRGSLHDEGMPLLERALVAKAMASDSEWWKAQLMACRSDERAILFVTLCAERWAPRDFFFTHAELLGKLLDSLDAHKWQSLASALEFRNVHRGKEDGAKLALKSVPMTCSPRWLCVLVSRLRPADQYRVWKRVMADYDGADVEVHRTAMRVHLDKAESTPSAWGAALPIVKSAHAAGAAPPPVRISYARSKTDMPVDTAQQICSTPGLYPLVLVGVAEAVLAAEAGLQAVPVINVAERDEWFENAD